MKKITSLLLALIMLMSAFTMIACDGTETPENQTEAPTEEATEAPEVIPETPYTLDCLRINGADIREFIIVSDTSLGGYMEYAATELQEYICTTTGVTLKISTTPVEAGTKRILLDGTATNNDEFRVYNDADGLVIKGTANIGIIQAVYHFLEEFLDWRFFTADTEVCYENDLIDLTDVDYTYVHPYAARGLYVFDYRRHPNAADYRLKRYHGGIDRSSNGIHTFGPLAETNTDGYSGNQPCPNDENVRATVLKNLHKFLDENPWVLAVHVSQDDNERYCQCDECLADLEYYGTLSGAMIELMNYICEDLETYNGGAYKDVYVVTFAYQYTLDAPDNIVCHDNVMIEFAIIDTCHQHPITYTECKIEDQPYVRENQGVKAQMDKWATICKQFYIWDYGHALKYYYVLTPNFEVLFDNYKYYNSIGALGYSYQCNDRTASAELGEIRNYLIAKLTEDPDLTEEEYWAYFEECGKAFYGAAWETVKEYYNFCNDMSNEFNMCYSVFSSPEVIYGDHAFGPHSDYLVELFDKAEALVADDEKALLHVRRLRISMDYLRIGAIHTQEMKSGDEAREQAMMQQVQTFWEECRELELNWPHESFQMPVKIRNRQNPRNAVWAHYYED